MMSLRMLLIWNLVFLSSFCFIFNNLSEAYNNQKKHPSAVVVGTVYCDTCFHQDFSKSSHFISGATVAVECRDSTNSRTSFRELVKTNEHGEFKVHLPFSVSKHVKKIKGCFVKLISSSEPFCAVASTATSSSLRLKSKKEGMHIFSAGFFTFKPLKQPELCDQKPSIKNFKKLNAVKSSISDPNNPTFFPPIRDPPSSDLPPLGQTYLPPLPSLPNLPNLPNLPTLPPLPGVPNTPPLPTKATSKESRTTSELSNKKAAQRRPFALNQFFPFPPNPFRPPSIFPPNPLLPPPSIFPPIPLLPPPSLLPPNPLLPPPSILPPNPLLPPPSIFPPNPLLPPPSTFPPNPLLPPPSILPPNPLQPPPSIFPPVFPSPPPSIFPPLFPSPPPSIFPPILPSPPSPPPSIFPPIIPSPGSQPSFNIPPLLPGLTPSPPPPRVPFFPFPFQPIPGFPGVPPAVPSSSSKKSHP